MSRRALALGVLAVVAYAGVYVATLRLGGPHSRPLFDGFAPSSPYRWVDPPPEFKAANVPPRPSTTDLVLGPDGLLAATATTEDGQVILNFPAGAVTANPGDTHLRVVIRPLAPATLGPLPAGLRPDGNAYRVELSYLPSGQPVEMLTVAGNVLLSVPEAALTLVYSPDGQVWERLETQAGGTHTAPVSVFTRPGYYQGGADPATAQAGSGGSSDTARVVLVVAVIVAVVLALTLMPVLVRRRRQPAQAKQGVKRRPAQKRRQPARRQPAGRKPARRPPGKPPPRKHKKKKKKKKGR